MANAQVAAPHEASEHAGEGTHTVLALSQRHGGTLERVLGVLRRRAGTVASINISHVASEEGDDLARITATLRGTSATAEQTAEHLRKLVDVRWAITYPTSGSDDDLLLREFALVRVVCRPQTRRELVDIARLFEARVVDVADESITIEASGAPETIANLLRMLRPLGIRQLARTGSIALERGDESASADPSTTEEHPAESA